MADKCSITELQTNIQIDFTLKTVCLQRQSVSLSKKNLSVSAQQFSRANTSTAREWGLLLNYHLFLKKTGKQPCDRHITCLRLTLGSKPVHLTKATTTRTGWCNQEQERAFYLSGFKSCLLYFCWYELGSVTFLLWTVHLSLISHTHTQHLDQHLACDKDLAQVS